MATKQEKMVSSNWGTGAYPSPLTVALITAASLFAAETWIMLLIPFINVSEFQRILIDSGLLTLFSLPILYALVYRPLVMCINRFKKAEGEKEMLIKELRNTITEVKTLSGLLPVCAWCKNIRDEKGEWKPIEAYISDHSDADFTHTICPDCYKEVSGEIYAKAANMDSKDKR